MTIATLNFALGLNNKDFIRGFKQAGIYARDFSGNVTRQTNKAGKSFNMFTASSILGLTMLRKAMIGLPVLALSVGGSLLAKSFLNTASSMEQLEMAIDKLSKGRGAETFAELNKWAKDMPINTEKAIQAFRLLKAYRLNPTLSDMTTIVDTVSALGGSTDILEGIARALGQIEAKGRPMQQEMNQLSERGVPALEILSRKLKLLPNQVADIGRQGLKSAVVLKALMEGMQEFAGGLSLAFMQTWKGQIERFKAWIMEFKRVVMNAGIFDALKEGLEKVLIWIETDGGQKQMQRWAKGIIVGTLHVFDTMTGTALAFYESMLDVKYVIESINLAWLELQAVFSGGFENVAPSWLNDTAKTLNDAANKHSRSESEGFSDQILAHLKEKSLNYAQIYTDYQTKIQAINKASTASSAMAVNTELMPIAFKEGISEFDHRFLRERYDLLNKILEQTQRIRTEELGGNPEKMGQLKEEINLQRKRLVNLEKEIALTVKGRKETDKFFKEEIDAAKKLDENTLKFFDAPGKGIPGSPGIGFEMPGRALEADYNNVLTDFNKLENQKLGLSVENYNNWKNSVLGITKELAEKMRQGKASINEVAEANKEAFDKMTSWLATPIAGGGKNQVYASINLDKYKKEAGFEDAQKDLKLNARDPAKAIKGFFEQKLPMQDYDAFMVKYKELVNLASREEKFSGLVELRAQFEKLSKVTNASGKTVEVPISFNFTTGDQATKQVKQIINTITSMVQEVNADVIRKKSTLGKMVIDNDMNNIVGEYAVKLEALKKQYDFVKKGTEGKDPSVDQIALDRRHRIEKAALYDKYEGMELEQIKNTTYFYAGALDSRFEFDIANVNKKYSLMEDWLIKTEQYADLEKQLARQQALELDAIAQKQAKDKFNTLDSMNMETHRDKFSLGYDAEDGQRQIAQQVYDLEIQRQNVTTQFALTEDEKIKAAEYFKVKYDLIQEEITQGMSDQWESSFQDMTSYMLDFVENGEWSWAKFASFAVGQIFKLLKTYAATQAQMKALEESKSVDFATTQTQNLTAFTTTQTSMTSILGAEVAARIAMYKAEEAAAKAARSGGGSGGGGSEGDIGGLVTGVLGGIFGGSGGGSNLGGLFNGTNLGTNVSGGYNIGSSIDFGFASGGMINETVVGKGLSSGASYAFGEKGPEMILNKDQMGQQKQQSSTNINQNITALDSQSLEEYISRNKGAFLKPLLDAVSDGNAGVLGAISTGARG